MSSQTVQQTNLNQVGFAPEVAPYAQNLLGTAAGVAYQYKKDPNKFLADGTTANPNYDKPIVDQNKFLADGTTANPNYGMPEITGFQPYQQYQGERVAQFSPLQKQSFEGAQGMQPAYQLTGASGLAGLAGQQALNTQYDPTNYQSQSFTGGDMAQQYMSPYMQNVVQRQQQDATRQAAIAQQAQGAQAARSGAFGGSGDYLMRAQAAGNLARQKGDIQATGLQNAYQQAMNQFNQEQQQRQQAAQLGEQSRQYGAGLGLQGLQTAMTGANTLGTLGQTQFGQGMDINKLQNTYGGQQQQQMNTILGNQYQDFLNRQNQPYKQLGFMSDIIRGAPLSQLGSTMYAPPPSAIQNIASLGLGAAGISKVFGMAKGGKVKSNGLGGLALNKLV